MAFALIAPLSTDNCDNRHCKLAFVLPTLTTQRALFTRVTQSPAFGSDPACGSMVLLSSVFGFSARSAEKPNTNKKRVPLCQRHNSPPRKSCYLGLSLPPQASE